MTNYKEGGGGSGLLSLFNFLKKFHFLQFFSDKKYKKKQKKPILEGEFPFFTPRATSKYGLFYKPCKQA